MTVKATTRDLRLRTKELIAATARGEEVVITFRGEPRAKLIGWQSAERPKAASGARNPAFGLWADRGEDVERQVRALRELRPAARC